MVSTNYLKRLIGSRTDSVKYDYVWKVRGKQENNPYLVCASYFIPFCSEIL